MSYFIFLKNKENETGCLYRIADNNTDLNNLNLQISDYKIIEDSINYNDFKFGLKNVIKYSDNVITYENNTFNIEKNQLKTYIDNFKVSIENFLKSNKNHLYFNKWSSYLDQLNNFNLDSITYPLNKSLEQYFNDLGQPSYSILQLP
jgi:hypothetical protein